MTEQSREQRRAEIAARVENATRGAWRSEADGGFNFADARIVSSDAYEVRRQSGSDARPTYLALIGRFDDAAFIAHARSDVPWLLSELARVEAALAESEAARVELAALVRRAGAMLDAPGVTGHSAELGYDLRRASATPSALAAQVRARHLREAADRVDQCALTAGGAASLLRALADEAEKGGGL